LNFCRKVRLLFGPASHGRVTTFAPVRKGFRADKHEFSHSFDFPGFSPLITAEQPLQFRLAYRPIAHTVHPGIDFLTVGSEKTTAHEGSGKLFIVIEWTGPEYETKGA
jgi:hypothetical protein